jgi:excisionase family DNA binding protein
MDRPKDKILTKSEAAQRLRVSDRTVDRLCATDGGLKKIQISMRRVGVSERSVDEYIAQRLGEAA